MAPNEQFLIVLLASFPMVWLMWSGDASSQSITPSQNGTDTVINRNGDRYTITGGRLSSDRENLFHSFEEFGLNANEIATFLSNPQIQNILGRVAGGNASIIDGLLQVRGSNANLYLMNPAGILFGPNARLDLPGSFSASTATGIGFENGWFNAAGVNDYASLVGTPNSYAFSLGQTGAIANLGNLNVTPEQSLSLIGGTVINAGQLSAPGGQITIAAIPGENVVRVSQQGMLLSLDIQSSAGTTDTNPVPFTPLTLPELLTGGGDISAAAIDVEPDGTVRLTGQETVLPIEAGTAIASGTLDVAATAPNQSGGTVRVLGEQVGLLETNINAAGTSNGGTILIGGDYQGQDTLPSARVTYVSPGSILNADSQVNGTGGEVIIWSDETSRIEGTISARGGATSGNGGLVETSSRGFLDVTTAPDVSAPGGTSGTWLIDPRNIIIGTGDPVIPGPPFEAIADNSFLPIAALRAALTGGATVIVSTGTTGAADGDITLAEPLDFDSIGSGTLRLEAANDININSPVFDNNTATADTLNLFLLADSDNTNNGRLNLSPFGRLDTGGGDIVGIGRSEGISGVQLNGPIQSNARTITLTGTGTQGILINNSTIALTGGGTVNLNGTGAINGSGIEINNSAVDFGSSTVNLTADEIGLTNAGLFRGSGSVVIQPATPGLNINLGGAPNTAELDLSTAEISTLLQDGFQSITIGRADGTGAIVLAGDITVNDPLLLRSPNSTINTTDGTITGLGNASVALEAAQAIATGTITTAGQAITLRSSSGAINTAAGALQTAQAGNAGDVSLNAPGGTIQTGEINTASTTGRGGAIAFNAAGTISTGNLTFGSAAGASSGALGLNTAGTVDLSRAIITDNGARINVGDTAPLDNIILPAGVFRTNGGVFRIARSGSLTLNGSVNTGGGNFSLSTTGGNLTLNGAIDTAGGQFQLVSAAELSLFDPVLTDGGTISLQGTAATTNSLDSSSDTAAGGDITLTATAGAIATANLSSVGTSGGSIRLNALTAITTGEINSSGSSGNGGDVVLDPIGNVSVASINAQGGTNGSGGNVDVTAGRFFQATRAFSDRNSVLSSISTAGGVGSGSITIRHGGNGVTPFVVGDSTTNGTAGAINSGNFTISPVRSFPDTFRLGNIGILTASSPAPPPVPVPAPEPTPTPVPTPTPDPQSNDLSFVFPPRVCPPDCPTPLPSDPLAEAGAITLEQAQQILQNIEAETGVKPALLYVNFVPTSLPLEAEFQRRERVATQAIANYAEIPTSIASLSLSVEPQASDELELLLITPTGEPIRRRLPGITRAQVSPVVRELFQRVTDRTQLQTTSYLPASQQLHQWIIEPVRDDLEIRQIQNIGFVMDAGLRSLPVAALHDGQQFLIEQYSVGLMPSLNLVDTRYTDIRDRAVLAMGASEFQRLPDLPAVPIELRIITQDLGDGKQFLNDSFTIENLRQQQRESPFSIIHLATHGQFSTKANSYIQFWDQQLKLDQLRQLRLNNPPVELLVLSACRTALGDEQAELGFAGFALQAGVKTALASLWYVSDDGTLGLMAEFYQQLRVAPIKAEALRQTQLAMLQGKVRIQDGQLQLSGGVLPLSSNLELVRNTSLAHPYYWSAFTLVGSPW